MRFLETVTILAIFAAAMLVMSPLILFALH